MPRTRPQNCSLERFGLQLSLSAIVCHLKSQEERCWSTEDNDGDCDEDYDYHRTRGEPARSVAGLGEQFLGRVLPGLDLLGHLAAYTDYGTMVSDLHQVSAEPVGHRHIHAIPITVNVPQGQPRKQDQHP